MKSSVEEHEFEPDPLLDACLDEVLGGQRPPDLKAQILRRLAASRALAASSSADDECFDGQSTPSDPLGALSASSDTRERKPSANRFAGDASPETLSTRGAVTKRAQQRESVRRRRRFIAVLLTASACVAVMWMLPRLTDQAGWPGGAGPIANQHDQGEPSDGQATAPPTNANARPSNSGDADVSVPDAGSGSDSVSGNVSLDPADPNAAPLPSGSDDASVAPDDANSPPGAHPADGGDNPADQRRPSPPRQRKKSNALMVAEVNSQLQSIWQLAQVTPAPQVADDVWFDRAVQTLLGRSPHGQESREFRAGQAGRDSEQLRAEWTERLLGPQYRAEFAAHWGTLWSEWLLDARALDESRVRVYRTGLRQYLQNVIERDSPLDDIVMSLLTAQGSNESKEPDYNPASNYLLALVSENEASATSQICRVLLGRRMECAQCHDDPTSDLKQENFWQLAAALAPLEHEVLRAGRGRLQEAHASQLPQVRFQQPDGNWKSVNPALPDGRPLELAPGESPREHLAERLVASNQMARAAVNRMWRQVLRYGFTLPVDDMGRHNPVAHPELVDLLSSQFAAHDYDMKSLLRWIVLSDAFDRSEIVTVGNEKDFPDGGAVALFSRQYHRPTLFGQAEDALNWLAEGRVPQVTSSVSEQDRAILAGRRNRNLTEQSDAANSLDVASPIGQLLPSAYLHHVRSLTNGGKLDRRQQLDHAFRIVLSRGPTESEHRRAEAIYAAAEGNDVVALERIFWALLNTGRI